LAEVEEQACIGIPEGGNTIERTRRGGTLLLKSTSRSEATVERRKCAARWSWRAQTIRPGRGGAEQRHHGSDPFKKGLDP